METESSTIKIVLRTRPTQFFASNNIRMDLNENVRQYNITYPNNHNSQ